MLTKITDDLYIDLSKINSAQYWEEHDKVEVYLNDFNLHFVFSGATGKELLKKLAVYLGN